MLRCQKCLKIWGRKPPEKHYFQGEICNGHIEEGEFVWLPSLTEVNVSEIQTIVEDGYQTKLMIINEAAYYIDVLKEIKDFLYKKAKCIYNRKVTVAISIKVPIPKEYSDAVLTGERTISAK